MARLLAPKLGEALGASIIVENKPGGSSEIVARAVAVEMTQWYGLMAPSKWPKANVAKLEAEVIKAEQARWKPVIARAQIKPDGA